MYRGGYALAFALTACGAGSGVLDEPVLVDAKSIRWLRCITVSVDEQSPTPRKVAAQKLFDALRDQGVRTDRLTYSKRDGATARRGW